MNTPFNPDIAGIATRPRIALIQSCWHRDVVDQFRNSFLAEFESQDGRAVELYEVPGAFELPLQAKVLAATSKYAGIVAAGLIVDGGTYRHDFVSIAVINGLMQAQLETGVPVFSGVLTPHDFLSEGRSEFFKEHFVVKGIEVASACAQSLGHYAQKAVA